MQRLPEQVGFHLQVAPGHDVVERAHALEQRDILKGSGYTVTCRDVWRHLFAGFPLECNRTLLGLIKAVDDIEHRAFAGTVGADNRANLASLDIKADVVQDFHDPEGETDILDLEDFAPDAMFIHAAASWVMLLTGYTAASHNLISASSIPVRPSSKVTWVSTWH